MTVPGRDRRVVRRYEVAAPTIEDVILVAQHRRLPWRRPPTRRAQILDVSVAGLRVGLRSRVEVNETFRIRLGSSEGRVRIRWVAPAGSGIEAGLVVLRASDGFTAELHRLVARFRSPGPTVPGSRESRR